ncbi:MAG TPA: hypothetical protein VGG75_19670 [Trebonia sp.]|jgi:hypothetical protein
MPLETSRAPVSASPLWIIALFIALSEVTAGVASITTNDVARLIFACFAVAFPAVVFGTFIWLLIKHAPKLYAPGQYSKDITPEIYRIGIRRADSMFIGQAVAKSVAPLIGGYEGTEGDAAVARVAEKFAAALDESIITVNLEALKPGARDLSIPSTLESGIQDILNEIYFTLEPAVPVASYDPSWILVDKDGNPYGSMGISWASKRGLVDDPRTINEVGISPGMRLAAVPKRR